MHSIGKLFEPKAAPKPLVMSKLLAEASTAKNLMTIPIGQKRPFLAVTHVPNN